MYSSKNGVGFWKNLLKGGGLLFVHCHPKPLETMLWAHGLKVHLFLNRPKRPPTGISLLSMLSPSPPSTTPRISSTSGLIPTSPTNSTSATPNLSPSALSAVATKAGGFVLGVKGRGLSKVRRGLGSGNQTPNDRRMTRRQANGGRGDVDLHGSGRLWNLRLFKALFEPLPVLRLRPKSLHRLPLASQAPSCAKTLVRPLGALNSFPNLI